MFPVNNSSIFRYNFRYILLVIIGITVANSSLALSFGPVRVKSTMGQTLNAEVDIYGTDSEIRNVNVKMARSEDYEKLKVEYKFFMRDIIGEFVRANDKSKRTFFKFTTKTPFYQPQANILLEAVWPEGRSIKTYSLIINPSENIQGIARGLNAPGARFDLPGQASVIREDIPYQDSPLNDGFFNNALISAPVKKSTKIKVPRKTVKKDDLPPMSVDESPEITAKRKELDEINSQIKDIKKQLDAQKKNKK